jgi:hypothetical protein
MHHYVKCALISLQLRLMPEIETIICSVDWMCSIGSPIRCIEEEKREPFAAMIELETKERECPHTKNTSSQTIKFS